MQDKDAYYFPHFCNARHDRKVRRLRKELGLEGYGIFFMLLETLREQADYSYPMEDIDLLVDEFVTSEQKIRTVISNYGLFEQDDQERFFSSKLIMYLQPYLMQKNTAKINGIKGNLVKYRKLTREEVNSMSDIELLDFNEAHKNDLSGATRGAIAIKVNKTKVNKTKLKESIPNNIGEELRGKLIEFIDYRTQIKKPLKTERPITSMINSIGSEYVDEKHLILCIDETMNHEWQGVKGEYIKDYNAHGKTEYRTDEEKRYYQLLEMSKKDTGVTKEELESKRLAMENSLKGVK